MRSSNSRPSVGSNAGGRYHFLRLYRTQGKHIRRRLARADPRQLALLSFLAVLSVFSFVVYFITTRISQGFREDLQIFVSTANVDITPREVVPLSGYAWRSEAPANTSVNPTWSPLRARVLVMRTPVRFVLVTLDVVGIDSAYASSIFLALNQSLGVMRKEVHIVCSHTHSGPFVGRNLWPLLPDGRSNAAVTRYSDFLRNSIVHAVRKALAEKSTHLVSAFFGKGEMEIPVNRRQVEERLFDARTSKHGDIDRELPVIWFREADSNKIIAGMYGVAAHATILTKSTQYSGDYPGAVSKALEDLYPDSTWFYLPGCGGDVNIYPRGSLDLLEQHRDAIVTEIQRVVADPVEAEDVFLGRPNASAKRETVELQFQKRLAAANLKPLTHSNERATRKWARSTLLELKNGNKTAPSYDYEMSLWVLGSLKMLFLAGEPTVGYASKLRDSAGIDWVVGYTDDVMGYIGTSDVIAEGKREGSERAAHYYGLPSTWQSDAEVKIISKAREMCVDA